jgi:hypothetical protein
VLPMKDGKNVIQPALLQCPGSENTHAAEFCSEIAPWQCLCQYRIFKVASDTLYSFRIRHHINFANC